MKCIPIYLLLFYCILSRAQDPSNGITLSFENTELNQVLEAIEGTTDYRFFYLKDWLGDTRITASFENTPLSEVLETVFRDTFLNFYILEDRIILTQNSRIYDQLPDYFLEMGDTIPSQTGIPEVAKNTPTPVFELEQSSATLTGIETFRIGKANAQNLQKTYRLSGFVRDSKTANPIQDITIVLKNSNLGAVSNEQGYYELELPVGLNIIETKGIGLENIEKRVLLYNNGQLDFDLNENVEQLDEVIVAGAQRANVTQEITGTTTIESEDSKDIPLVLGERNILSIATTLPGISSAGEGATGLNVRGGRTDQNLILLDQGLVYNPTHFFGIFQALNPFVTKDVDIYKGGIPAQFGGRLSSVFDIKTIDGNTEKISGEASIGPVTGNVSLEIPVVPGKSSLVFGGRGAYSDWILQSLDDPDLSNSTASFYDAIVKYKHEINDKNTVSATAYYSKDNFSITNDSLFNYSNRLVSANWTRQLSDRSVMNLNLANSQYRFGIEFDGQSNTDFDLGYQIDETEINAKFKFVWDEVHTVDYGIASKLYGVKPGFIDPLNSESDIQSFQIPREKGLESAVFISDNITFSERFSVVAGLRFSFFAALGPAIQNNYEEGQPRNAGSFQDTTDFDNNEVIQTYGGPEVRVSGRYLFTPDFSVKASFNTMYQYIHTLSNTTTVSPLDTWKLSDGNIKPQRATQYALGFYKNFQENMYEFSVEGYYKNMEDVLDFKTGAQLLLNDNIETEVIQGQGKAYGVEVLLRKNLGKLNGWLGYTYSRSLIKFDSEFSEERINGGQYFPSNFDKPHDVSLIANYKFTRRYGFSLNFAYQTGRPVTYPIGQYNFNNAEYVFYSNRNEFRIPDYYRLDLGLNIEGNHKKNKLIHSFWNISVYNVLGRANPYSVFFVTEGGEVKAYQSSIFAVAIPSITYNFKF